MRRYEWSSTPEGEQAAALARPEEVADEALIASVKTILADVKARGDDALSHYTARFDTEETVSLRVEPSELEAAWDALSASDQAVIERPTLKLRHYYRLFR